MNGRTRSPEIPTDAAMRAHTEAARVAVAAGVSPYSLVVGLLSAIHGHGGPGREGQRVAREVAARLEETSG